MTGENLGGLIAGLVLVLAVALKAWASFHLMTHYRIDDYLATAKARRFYWTAMVAPIVACLAIVALAATTRLWWLVVPAVIFLSLISARTTWAVRLRLSGAYAEYARQRRWR